MVLMRAPDELVIRRGCVADGFYMYVYGNCVLNTVKIRRD